eukprot:TRINITY_DN1352_c0_g1_i1.p1 TRINITY_DN1352_c0_g1~~TRINITY_DN1352_c0_g1_i1.p1  ORF type:complete len:620 (+),score=96.96 TRINITY_DN1352_c0_g1_i1:134-1993(+)
MAVFWIASIPLFVLILYFSNEGWIWHRSDRTELFFWYIFFCYVNVSICFLQLPYNIRLLVLVPTLIFTYYSLKRIKKRVRARLNKFEDWRKDKESVVKFSKTEEEEEANQLVEEINKLAVALESSTREFGGYTGTTRAVVVANEQRIISLLRSLNYSNCNYVVQEINLPMIIKDFRDHITGDRPQNKTRLLSVLCDELLPFLSPDTKTVLIDAFQKIGISTIPEHEKHILNIFLSCGGKKLTKLKNLVDAAGSHHDLQHLIFTDIVNPDIRHKILEHITKEAWNNNDNESLQDTKPSELGGNTEVEIKHQTTQLDKEEIDEFSEGEAEEEAVKELLGENTKEKEEEALDKAEKNNEEIQEFQETAPKVLDVKVISDIDDTLYCQLLDRRWPTGTIYPGIRSFYRELDVGRDEKGRVGDLVFLTARPGGYKGMIENYTHKMLTSFGLHTRPTVLCGSTAYFVGNNRIATKKYENFVQYKSLFPEYSFVLVGDSGQGDATLCERLLQDSSLYAAFIHDVVHVKGTPRGKAFQKAGIFFFDTYVGAALKAYSLGLISREGVKRIGRSAREEFLNIKFPPKVQALKEQRSRELNQDLDYANKKLNLKMELIGEPEESPKVTQG